MKKAQFDLSKAWILWLLRIGIVIIVIIYLYAMVGFNISKKQDVDDLTLQIIQQKLLYSPDCFVYQDDKFHPGIFDMNKLNEEVLQSCLDTKEYGVEINLILDNQEKTIFLNQDITKDKVLCGHEKAIRCMKDSHYILIKEGDKLKPAFMQILIINYKT